MAKLTYFIAYKVDIGIKNITLKLLIDHYILKVKKQVDILELCINSFRKY